MKEPSKSGLWWAYGWLAYSVLSLIFALVTFVRDSNVAHLSSNLVMTGAAAALALALLSLHRSDVAEWRAKTTDARLSTLVDSLPPDRRAAFGALAKAYRVLDETKPCKHHGDSQEFIAEAGMWRCTDCGRAVTKASR